MQIQNNNNINFQAKRVMTTHRYFSSNNRPKLETMDVFKLNKAEDVDFAKKCLLSLSTKMTRDLKPLQRQLKVFFNSFLMDNKREPSDFYLMINNGEELSGGIISFPCKNSLYITQAFSTYPKDYNLDNLLYAYLNDSQKNYGNYKIQTNNLVEKFKNRPEILPENITSIKHKITLTHPKTQFIALNEKEDLENFLGIKDFELEINPHLK